MSDPADAMAHARVGTTLNDKWTLERLIGIGGMAAVYAARHRNGARAAIKVLHPDIAKIKEAHDRFVREGYAANRVEHPGVVKVLDDERVSGGPDDGTAYLVMELLDGESLEDRIERGPSMGELELLPILKGVLEVLVAAHARGVIHRDLKPENLFLAKMEDGSTRVKVLDFGLARMQERSIQTMVGLALGTPSYMPPEQAAGRVAEIDGRSDLFALGASCFRLLSGRRVHPGTDPLDIVMKMMKEPAPKLRTVAPHVSEAVATIIDRALEFKPEDRYPDASAMLADVNAVLARAPDAPAAAAEEPPNATAPNVPKRRSVLPLLGVLALAGAFAWLAWDTFFRGSFQTHEDAAPARDANEADAKEPADAELDVALDVASDVGVEAATSGDASTLTDLDAAETDRDGSAKDGSAKDGGAKDGGAKDGGAKDGAKDGGAKVVVRDAGKPAPKASTKPAPTKPR